MIVAVAAAPDVLHARQTSETPCFENLGQPCTIRELIVVAAYIFQAGQES